MTFHPDPKPEKDPERPRAYGSTLPRRRAPMNRSTSGMNRSGPLSRSAAIERTAPKRRQDPESRAKRTGWKNRTRRQREAAAFARQYHSDARRAFVNSLPCAACGVRGLTQNAHTQTGGMGTKAGYLTIAPLCGPSYDRPGCHAAQEGKRPDDADRALGLPVGTLARAAAATEAAWQNHTNR